MFPAFLHWFKQVYGLRSVQVMVRLHIFWYFQFWQKWKYWKNMQKDYNLNGLYLKTKEWPRAYCPNIYCDMAQREEHTFFGPSLVYPALDQWTQQSLLGFFARRLVTKEWNLHRGEKWSRKKIFQNSMRPLQSCCCPVQKNIPRKTEMARLVGRYLWRSSWNFKIILSRPIFAIILKQKTVFQELVYLF